MHVAPFPQLPVKALALWLLGARVGVVGGSWAFEKHLPSSPVDSIWNKANFPFNQPGLFIGFWAVRSQTRLFANNSCEAAWSSKM